LASSHPVMDYTISSEQAAFSYVSCTPCENWTTVTKEPPQQTVENKRAILFMILFKSCFPEQVVGAHQ